jgi:hypothetical protein
MWIPAYAGMTLENSLFASLIRPQSVDPYGKAVVMQMVLLASRLTSQSLPDSLPVSDFASIACVGQDVKLTGTTVGKTLTREATIGGEERHAVPGI